MTYAPTLQSSGWLRMPSYVIRVSYDQFIMLSGWHTLPLFSHPDDLGCLHLSSGVTPIHHAIWMTYAPTLQSSGPTFIKPDQLDPWIKDQMKITLLSTISSLQLPNFVSCGRDKPSHMTQNLVTVGTKLWTSERYLFDPWSMDQADLVW